MADADLPDDPSVEAARLNFLQEALRVRRVQLLVDEGEFKLAPGGRWSDDLREAIDSLRLRDRREG